MKRMAALFKTKTGIARSSLCLMICFVMLAIAILNISINPVSADAAGATTSLHIVMYSNDGQTVVKGRTVDYKWMMQNLPVYGDGTTHYYFQGPVFEGDQWDPTATVNLKDKGAVKGTDIKDLCDLVGGMTPGSEIVIHAVDGYEITLAYANVYQPMDLQGPAVLCWYKAQDPQSTDPGYGYPANDAFGTAIELVFMTKATNQDGQHVFGNTDMKIVFPEDKYQHYYEGLPSTNGLCVKWVSELRIYPGGVPANVTSTTTNGSDVNTTNTNTNQNVTTNSSISNVPAKNNMLWLPIVLGVVVLALVVTSIFLITRKRGNN